MVDITRFRIRMEVVDQVSNTYPGCGGQYLASPYPRVRQAAERRACEAARATMGVAATAAATPPTRLATALTNLRATAAASGWM